MVAFGGIAKRVGAQRRLTGGGGSPCHPDPLLLDLLLLKLAFGFTWNELPQNLPVRSARTLYRQLYLSGRMAAIYTLLHRHLDNQGSRALDEIAGSHAVTLEGRLVVPTLEESLTWEVRTAFLLLQRALFNERKQKRLEDIDRRPRRLYLREASILRLPRFPSSGSHTPAAFPPDHDSQFSNLDSRSNWQPSSFVPLALRKKDKSSDPSPLPRACFASRCCTRLGLGPAWTGCSLRPGRPAT